MTINPTLKNIVKIACLSLVLLTLALRAYQPVEIEDIWWHLKTGEWIDHNKTIPIKDPFPLEPNEKIQTFTQMYSQWLGSLTFYKVYQLGEEEGLKLFRSFIFFFTFLLLFLFARKKIPFAFLIWLILLAAPALESRSFLRPLMFNFLFVQAFIIILFSYERDPKTYKLFFVLPLGALWSNLHLGSFVYGTTLLGISILASIVNYVRNQRDCLKRKTSLRKTKELFAFTLLYWLMFGINPFGLDALLHNWKVFLDPTYVHFSILDKMIMELQSPGNIFHLSYIWLHAILILNFILLFHVHSQKRLYFTLLYLFSCFFFIYALRGSDFAILLQFYIAAEMSDILRLKVAWQKLRFSTLIGLILLFFIISHCCLSTVQTLRTYVHQDSAECLYLSKKLQPANPARILSFLNEKNIKGPIFNDDIMGGYLTWRSYPSLRPFIDGRQTNMNRFFFYISAYDNPEKNWEPLDKRFHFFAIMLVNRAPEALKLIRYFIKDPTYIFSCYDNNIVLLIRKDLLDEGSLAEIDQDKILNETKLSAQDINELKEISSRKIQNTFWQALFKKRYVYIDTFEDAILLYNLGYREAAGKKIIEAAAVYPKTEAVPDLLRFLAADLSGEIDQSYKNTGSSLGQN